MQRGAGDLDDEAAADVAAYVAAVRGPCAPGTTAAECRSLSPAFLADVWQVRVLCPLASQQIPSSSTEQWPLYQCAVRHLDIESNSMTVTKRGTLTIAGITTSAGQRETHVCDLYARCVLTSASFDVNAPLGIA